MGDFDKLINVIKQQFSIHREALTCLEENIIPILEKAKEDDLVFIDKTHPIHKFIGDVGKIKSVSAITPPESPANSTPCIEVSLKAHVKIFYGCGKQKMVQEGEGETNIKYGNKLHIGKEDVESALKNYNLSIEKLEELR